MFAPCLVVLLWPPARAFVVPALRPPPRPRSAPPVSSPLFAGGFGRSSGDDPETLRLQQKMEAARCVETRHDGIWEGCVSAVLDASPFAGSRDDRPCFLSAGGRRYACTSRTSADADGVSHLEVHEWTDAAGVLRVSRRNWPLSAPGFDLDAEDASFSTDHREDMGADVPSLFLDARGTGTFPWVVEHVSPVESDGAGNEGDVRVRALLCYSRADTDANALTLERVVVCEERRRDAARRRKNANAEVLKRVQEEDRQRASILELARAAGLPPDRLQELRKVADTSKIRRAAGESVSQPNYRLQRHPMTIATLSSGAWTGDGIPRDHHRPKNKQTAKRPSPSLLDVMDGFAEWRPSLPYKIAIQYQWDRRFQDSRLRQVTSILPGGMAAVQKEKGEKQGDDITVVAWSRFMGTRKVPLTVLPPSEPSQPSQPSEPSDPSLEPNNNTATLPVSLATFEFTDGYVAFLLGSLYIKAPRTVSAPSLSSAAGPPPSPSSFLTEVAVFHRRTQETEEGGEATDDAGPPELFCSRSTRVYEGGGGLRRTSNEFLSLQRGQ